MYSSVGSSFLQLGKYLLGDPAADKFCHGPDPGIKDRFRRGEVVVEETSGTDPADATQFYERQELAPYTVLHADLELADLWMKALREHSRELPAGMQQPVHTFHHPVHIAGSHQYRSHILASGSSSAQSFRSIAVLSAR